MTWGEAGSGAGTEGAALADGPSRVRSPGAGRWPWGRPVCAERGSGALSWGRALKTLWIWEEITHNGPAPETGCAVPRAVLLTGAAVPVVWRS